MDLINELFVTESPDATSIIAAFEAKRNPLELFFKEEFRSLENLEETLNIIDDKIDDLSQWLLLYHPHINQDGPRYKRCMNKFTEIQNKIYDLNKMYHRNSNNSCYKVTCAQCDTQFNLNNYEDINNLENHKHVVDMLLESVKPSNIISKIPKIKYDFPIQSVSITRNRFRCLLCQVLLHDDKCLRSHIKGRTHKKKLKNPKLCKRTSDFIEHFQKLPLTHQVFQIIFEIAPEDMDTNVVLCRICGQHIYIHNIPKHVTTNKLHHSNFLSKDYSYLNHYNEMLELMEIDCGQKDIVESSLPSTSAEVSTNHVMKTEGKSKKKHKIIHAYLDIKTDRPVTIKDLIPNRLKSHGKFITGDIKVPFCTLCKYLIKNLQGVVLHILSKEHASKCRTDLVKNYLYYCCICCRYFKTELKWTNHMSSLAHIQKESLLINPALQTSFQEYECTNCLLVWYGQQHSIRAHKKNKFGTNERRKQREIILSPEITRLLKDELHFKAFISKVSRESNDVLNSIDSAQKCCRAIEEALWPTFGEQIKAYPFGSRVSGLGNIASDLDVFVDTGLMYEGAINQSAESQSFCVQQTALALRKHKDFIDICPIPQARTPIVQVYHKITDLDCDLSFRHGLSIENTQFLKFCIDVQPKLKSIILFLKKWIHSIKFRDRISTYSVSLMAIYMMQNKGYLPSLAEMRQIDPQTSKIIAGWETFNFEKPISELRLLYPLYARSERDLLGEFFEFYIEFDFKEMVICPLLGKSVSKMYFIDAESSEMCLPTEMFSYVRKIRENKNHEKLKITKSICIQDPFDLSHNVTKALPFEILLKMIALMKQCYLLLLPK